MRIVSIGTAAAAAALPAFPHLLLQYSTQITALAAILSYAPLIHILSARNPGLAGAAILGAIHGAALTLIGAWWVWSFLTMPPPLPVTAAITVGAYYAAVFAVLHLALKRGRLFQRLFAPTVLPAAILASAELARSWSSDLFLPLATLGFAAAEHPFIAVAGVAGVPGLALIAFASASAIAGLAQNAARQAGVVTLIAVTATLVVANLVNRERARAAGASGLDGALCAYSDAGRRDRPWGKHDEAAEFAPKVRSAARSGCALVAFPELTAITDRGIAPAAKHGLSVVAGVSTRVGAELEAVATNSVCAVRIEVGQIVCTERIDKRYLIPFVEADLFFGTPWLAPFGSWLTKQLTGNAIHTVVEPAGNVLAGPGGMMVGVITCVEIFLPGLNFARADGRHSRPDLIIAPIDHSAFPRYEAIRAVTRQAGRLQAVVASVPLLLASTEETVLFSGAGIRINPSLALENMSLWRSLPLAHFGDIND